MAEEGKENPNEGSWWGSWINSAKTKTSTVFEAVKKDLGELSTAVKTEALNARAAVENTFKFNEEDSPVGTVKESLSSFFGQVTEALIPSIDDDEVECVLITRDGAITLTGFQKHLADLQNNEKTYLDEPNKELQDKYKLWMEVIEQDQFTQDRLAKHLASSEILNEKYLNLVPEKISHMEFWQRYLFKRALLEDAIANAEIAERRAKSEINSTKSLSPRKNIIQTEQPKLTCNENDIITAPITTNITDNDNSDNIEKDQQEQQQNKNSDDSTDIENLDDELLDENINWDGEEIPNNVELSEEEQIRLLEQYEQEIQEREKKRNENNGNNKGKKNINSKSSTKTTTTTTNTASTTNKTKTISNPQKINNSNNKKLSPQKQQQQQQHRQRQQQHKTNKDNENLIVQKDHFNKDETSSTSDESWEKDFDLND